MGIAYTMSNCGRFETAVVAHEARLWRYHHERYAFCSVCSGGSRSWFRGGIRESAPGFVPHMAPGDVHHTFEAEPGSYQIVWIDPQAMDEACRALGAQKPLRFRRPNWTTAPPSLFEATQAASSAIAGGEGVEAAILDLARQATLHLTETSIEPERAERLAQTHLVARVMNRLCADMLDPPSIGALAAEMGVSEFQLLRRFKRETGVAPHQFLIAQRINEARRLLSEGTPPAFVAVEVGFHDQSHLTRHFKRAVGVTPGRYQNQTWSPRPAVHANTGALS